MMSWIGIRRRGDSHRTIAAVSAFLGSPICAHAASRGLSDSDVIYLGYAFVVAPIYVILMLVALGIRFLARHESAGTASRSVQSYANLFPLAATIAYVSYKYIGRPLLPGYYSDYGFYVTWGCILAPLPLAFVANYAISRLPGPHRVASSQWWIGLYGVIGAAVVWTIVHS